MIAEVELNNADSYTIKIRAGAIEKKIRYSNLICTHEACQNIFSNNEDKIEGIFFETLKVQRPTKSTVQICELVYKFFTTIENRICGFDYKAFYGKVINSIPFENLFRNIDFSHERKHKSMLILIIIDEYVRLHATYIARKMTLDTHSVVLGN